MVFISTDDSIKDLLLEQESQDPLELSADLSDGEELLDPSPGETFQGSQACTSEEKNNNDEGNHTVNLTVRESLNGVQKKIQKRRRFSMSSRSSLIFPVARVKKKFAEVVKPIKVHTLLHCAFPFLFVTLMCSVSSIQHTQHTQVMVGASIYASAVLEYLTAELLELGGGVCKDQHKKRITPTHLEAAIRGDKELEQLLKDIHIPSASKIHFVHPVLLKSSQK